MVQSSGKTLMRASWMALWTAWWLCDATLDQLIKRGTSGTQWNWHWHNSYQAISRQTKRWHVSNVMSVKCALNIHIYLLQTCQKTKACFVLLWQHFWDMWRCCTPSANRPSRMITSCQNINKNPFCWTRKLYRGSTIDFWRPHLKPSLSPRSGNPDVWISRNGFLDSLQQFMRRKTIAPDTLLAARKAIRWPQQIVAVLRAEMTFNSLELLSTLPRDVRELVVPCWP